MDPLVRIGLRTARQVGKQILPTYDRPPYGRMGRTALQTFIKDLRSEMLHIFEDQIIRAYPTHSVSSDFTLNPTKDSVQWFIEVLDGETNFLRSLNDFCAAIGIYENGVIRHSLIYHYVDDQEFFATVELGAQVNRNRLRVSTTNKLAESVIALSGFHSSDPRQNSKLVEYIKLLYHHRVEFRTSGCTSLDIARVAQGKHDGCIASIDSLITKQIGALLVSEAGGMATGSCSANSYTVFSNPSLFGLLSNSLALSESINK
ncbi:MAG: hypothetical protein OXG88_04670 [Gammaproteobacteria bacterium]|nr:hypothetical protein [Gammaproteobacteria bacterium]